MPMYAGETLVLGADLKDETANRPFTPQPSVGVTFQVKSDDEVTEILAEVAGSRQDDETGTATGGAAKTLTDSTKVWTVNQWKGFLVRITSGTGGNQEKRVASNTATVLTIDEGTGPGQGAWTTNPDSTSVYAIHRSKYEKSWDAPAAQQGTTVTQIVRAKDAAFTSIEKKKLRLE